MNDQPVFGDLFAYDDGWGQLNLYVWLGTLDDNLLSEPFRCALAFNVTERYNTEFEINPMRCTVLASIDASEV